MVKTNLINSASPQGFISIDPQAGTASFPIYVNDDSFNSFSGEIVARNQESIRLIGCDASSIIFDNNSAIRAPNERDFYVTDGTWVNGISRSSPVFFVPNTPQNLQKFKEGVQIELGQGPPRTVKLVVAVDETYLHIHLSGEPFNQGHSLHPVDFVVLQN
jgi:hypothetical protein